MSGVFLRVFLPAGKKIKAFLVVTIFLLYWFNGHGHSESRSGWLFETVFTANYSRFVIHEFRKRAVWEFFLFQWHFFSCGRSNITMVFASRAILLSPNRSEMISGLS